MSAPHKEWAKDRFDRYQTDDNPYLIAYWDDGKLLLYCMNLPAVKLFGYPEAERDGFLSKHKEVDIGFLVKGSSYASMIACSGNEFDVELSCFKGFRRVNIAPYCFDEGVVFKVLESKTNIMSVLSAPQKINDILKGWVEVFKTTRGILIGASSVLLGLLGITIAPWAQFEPTAVQAAKDGTKAQVEQIIADEINLLPRHSDRIDHNGITVSKYLDNLESRQLYAGEIKGLAVLDEKALDVKSTKEDGWYQQLISHLGDAKYPNGRLHIIDRSEFEKQNPNHSLVIAMKAGGAEQVFTYPIRRNDRLVGYVAIGVRKTTTPKQRVLIEDRLKTISLKISIGTNFPG